MTIQNVTSRPAQRTENWLPCALDRNVPTVIKSLAGKFPIRTACLLRWVGTIDPADICPAAQLPRQRDGSVGCLLHN